MTTVESADAEHETQPPDEGENDASSGENQANRVPERRGHRRVGVAKRPRAAAALVVVLAIVVVLAGLCGWLAYRARQSHVADQQRAMFLAAARQEAVNLTTISYSEIDADIKRIIDSATGSLRDDFQKRSPAFVDVVKQAQSKSVGTVTAAGVESVSGDQAQVLVALAVKTSNAGAPEEQPRGWRMRINVSRVGDGVKVSDVAFVS